MTSVSEKLQGALSRNHELLGILSDTDFATPALEQQKRHVNDLNREIQVAQKRIAHLDKQRAKELKDHEKYRDSVMKRFAFRVSGKTERFAAKASKEEKEYFDVLQKEHKAKEFEENLQTLRAEALSVQSDLEAKASRHTQAQQQLDSLYDDIFKGPTPGFPEEDAMESNVEHALHVYRQSRASMEAEQQALRTLSQAQAQLRNALICVEDALEYSRRDMFGGGTFTDMMERNALSKAEGAVNQMFSLVSQAQRMSPSVQNLPLVRIAQGSLVSDVFFDNIFTDMAFHDKIKDSRDELNRCGLVLRDQAAQAQSRVEASEREATASSGRLKSARLELQKAREHIFERLGFDVGADGGLSSQAHPDVPPPYTS